MSDNENIYYNIGEDRIMIVTKWHKDTMGGAAIHDTTISLLPGEGIDLTIIGLSKNKPKTGYGPYKAGKSLEALPKEEA